MDDFDALSRVARSLLLGLAGEMEWNLRSTHLWSS
jgi:hypothetical protein